MPETIKAAILSYGKSGKVFHGPLLKAHPDFEVVKVWERTKSNAEGLFGSKVIVRSLEEILKDKNIALVIVNTPNATHYDYVKSALQAGKHVVVEKPFVTRTEHGEELIALAKRNGVVLTVFQNRRWDSDFLTVREVIDKKLLGRLVEYEGHFDRYRNFIQPGTWKEQADIGAGLVPNLGSHLIDQALCLFGKPKSVHADIRIMRTGGKVDDYFDIDLFYDAVKVKLKGSYLVREQGPRHILHGTEGSFLKWGVDPQEEMMELGHLPGEPDWGAEDKKYWGLLNTSAGGLHTRGRIESTSGNYSAFYDNVFLAISRGEELAVNPEESLLGIRIIESCYKSSKEGVRIKL